MKLGWCGGLLWCVPAQETWPWPGCMARVLGPQWIPLYANLQWHLLVTNPRCSCLWPVWACLLPNIKEIYFPRSRFSTVVLYILVPEVGLCLAWLICKPLIYHFYFLFWHQCVCLMSVGTGALFLLSPRARSIRCLWHGPFMAHSCASTLTVLL